jgi:hypothetical protein
LLEVFPGVFEETDFAVCLFEAVLFPGEWLEVFFLAFFLLDGLANEDTSPWGFG